MEGGVESARTLKNHHYLLDRALDNAWARSKVYEENLIKERLGIK